MLHLSIAGHFFHIIKKWLKIMVFLNTEKENGEKILKIVDFIFIV
jgi:hypothetical protein